MSNTHAVMEILSKLPVGSTFTGPELRKSLKKPMQSYQVSNTLGYLLTRGVVVRKEKGQFGTMNGKVPAAVTYELVNPNYQSSQMTAPPEFKPNGKIRHTKAYYRTVTRPRLEMKALILDIQQKLRLLEGAATGKSLSDYSTAELFTEMSRRTK